MKRLREQRLDEVVLAYALAGAKPRSVAQLATTTARYRPDGMDAPAWSETVAASVARLQAAGALDDARRPGPHADEARARLGMPEKADASKVRELVLPRLAMGFDTSQRLGGSNRWAAAIAARAWGLPTTLTASGLGDALVWRELGLRGKAKQVPDEVRAHFMRRMLGESVGEGDSARLLRLAAAKAVGAPRGDSEPLRDALVKEWLVEEAVAEAPAPAPSLESFAAAVHEAAHGLHEGRFGEERVFISAAWRRLRENPAFASLPLEHFKQRLIEAQRAGLLALARADHLGVMDPALVAESETHHLEARYHFILEDAA